MSYESRIPEIAAELSERLNLTALAVAEKVVERAKELVPVSDIEKPHLRDAIRAKKTAIGEYKVIAGDDETWYGHFLEFGTVRDRTALERSGRTHAANQMVHRRSGAHPFLVPAAEAVRKRIDSLGRDALRDL